MNPNIKKSKLISSYYIPSESTPFQGNSSALSKKCNQGWSVKRGSNGSYILVKPSQAIFVFEANSHKYKYDMREYILEVLSKKKLTQNSFDKFEKKIHEGKISVYIDEDGFYELI